MSELKTLKDFEEDDSHEEGFDCTSCNDVCVSKLRQEAIKHIKELRLYEKRIFIGRDEEFDVDKYIVNKHRPAGCIESHCLIIWIKDFFNITEEDLK